MIIVEVLPFDDTQITSGKNWSHPRYGDPCHPLASQQHPPLVAIKMRAEDDLIDEKYPFARCESTDEGATLITDYISVKNWKLA